MLRSDFTTNKEDDEIYDSFLYCLLFPQIYLIVNVCITTDRFYESHLGCYMNGIFTFQNITLLFYHITSVVKCCQNIKYTK